MNVFPKSKVSISLALLTKFVKASLAINNFSVTFPISIAVALKAFATFSCSSLNFATAGSSVVLINCASTPTTENSNPRYPIAVIALIAITPANLIKPNVLPASACIRASSAFHLNPILLNPSA